MSPAPLLVRGARVWSGGALLDADSVLLAESRVAAVGRALESHPAAAGARIVEAAGATVTPGLCDAHLHFVPWARARRQCALAGGNTGAEELARVAASLAADPGPGPLVGRG